MLLRLAAGASGNSVTRAAAAYLRGLGQMQPDRRIETTAVAHDAGFLPPAHMPSAEKAEVAAIILPPKRCSALQYHPHDGELRTHSICVGSANFRAVCTAVTGRHAGRQFFTAVSPPPSLEACQTRAGEARQSRGLYRLMWATRQRGMGVIWVQ